MTRSLVSALMLSLLLVGAAPARADGPKGAEDRVLLTLDGVPLVTAVRWMAEHTGRSFIVAKGLGHRKLTIISGTPVTRQEAYDGFVAALEASGMKLEPAGELEKIVRSRPGRKARPDAESKAPRDCGVADGVQPAGEGTWTLTTAAYERMFADDHCFSTQARVVPSYVGGAVQGIRLFGIRKGSVFHRLGLRNGDTVEAIGDTLLDSPHEALHLYSEASKAKPRPGQSAKVHLLRSGEKRLHTYTIR